jgi:hypothetical protein
MHRLVLCSLVILPLLTVNANAAITCSQQAAICMQKGGSQATCYEPSRMASCTASGTYVSPSGKSLPAIKGRSKPAPTTLES